MDPLLPALHVPVCSAIAYPNNPPTSGSHYGVWAAFKSYLQPVPLGFLVHDMEHGAVVIFYNCLSDCGDQLALLQDFVDARPVDPLCVAPVKRRVVVTPDPTLTSTFAAAAWGFSLTSDCFDLPALGAFMDAHYAMGPENFCSDGADYGNADAGADFMCGQ